MIITHSYEFKELKAVKSNPTNKLSLPKVIQSSTN